MDEARSPSANAAATACSRGAGEPGHQRGLGLLGAAAAHRAGDGHPESGGENLPEILCSFAHVSMKNGAPEIEWRENMG